MKRAAIISCNDNYDYDTRTKYVSKYLEKNGYKVDFIIADFDHRNKMPYIVERDDNIIYIHVGEYDKNLSIRRIKSHIEFARGVEKYLSKQQYEVVYHCAPPNYTIKVLSKLKKKKKFKLITEIGDMWPETMPVPVQIKQVLFIPLRFWSNLRDKYLDNSDVIVAECNLFNKQLREKTGIQHRIKTIYFCKKANYVEMDIKDFNMEDRIELCYLGSINNIIDCDIIGTFINELSNRKETIVHIIGDGEKKRNLIDSIESNGGKVQFYGKVFDEEEKKKIFSKCQYALNIMKTDVNVGMTMKSLDYFAFGIPIINNIGGDIEKMVETQKIGFNINAKNIKLVVDAIEKSSLNDYMNIRNNVKRVHEKYFSIEKFNQQMKEIL